MTLFLRKVRIGMTPTFMSLTTRLKDGTRITGRSRRGWGGRGIYLMRDEYEPELTHLDQLLSPGQVFIDVGANVGVFSMKAATIVGKKGVVIAVEPFPEMVTAIWRNMVLNGYDQVRIRQGVVSNELGEKTFWMNQGKPNSFSLDRSDESSSAFSVLSMRIDDLVEWERLEQLHYLKIDAEGAELLVLEGAQKALHKFRPIVQVEVILVKVPVPEGYSSFRFPNGPNVLFVPNEHPAIKRLEALKAERL